MADELPITIGVKPNLDALRDSIADALINIANELVDAADRIRGAEQE